MAVEKMVMVNSIGKVDDLDRILKAVVLFGYLHPVNAIEVINTADFVIKVDEKNKSALMGIDYIRPFSAFRDYKALQDKIGKANELRNAEAIPWVKRDELILDFDELNRRFDAVLERFAGTLDSYRSKKSESATIQSVMKRFSNIAGLDIKLEELLDMKYFYASFLKVPNENIVKLEHNYKNIPSIVFDIMKNDTFQTYIAFTPTAFKVEADRIFRSLNCEEIMLEQGYHGTPGEILSELQKRAAVLDNEINQLEDRLRKVKIENRYELGILTASADLEMKCDSLKRNVAYSKDFFYLCGWLPFSETKHFRENLQKLSDEVMIFEKDVSKANIKAKPPTRLKNNPLIKPFETMVYMYGIPSYGELDPTGFFGISYTVLFGAMFGDVGQGFLFLAAGIVMKWLMGMATGGIVALLGLSSMIFGFGYGSIFGFEHVIEPILIRPMENIMETLIFAVVFGLLLLMTGYSYSIVNHFRKKDLENGVFGKDGLAGILLYISAIVFALTKFQNVRLMPDGAWIALFALFLALLLLKEPVANLLQKRRPIFSKSKSDYFVEEGFGVVEALLSMFTNTLSFIRVGAFALNHVGLFLAFSALATMMGSSAGSVLVYVIGNVVIIGLEGLIVFIQGLRLEYYELFSKYYEADGIPYKPVCMDCLGSKSGKSVGRNK